MATRKTKSSQQFTGFRSVADVSRQFIEAPMDAARVKALASAMQIVDLLNMLPDAFASSQQRELERVRASGGENDPRVAPLEATLAQVDVLRAMAQKGRARVERAAAIAADPENAFHGFVTTTDLEPLEGLTVRLRGEGGELTATTGADGYFRIPLGSRRTARPDRMNAGMAQRMADMASRLNRQSAGAAAEEEEKRTTAQVDVLRGNRVIHRDPLPLVIRSGRAYREYRISP